MDGASTKVEECWTLVGCRRGGLWLARRIDRVAGDVAQVEFRAQATLAREEQRGDVVGFLHTHPHGPHAMSVRDVRTMRSWCASFGKPLLCLIDVAGRLYGWRFDDEASAGEPLGEIGVFPRGKIVAAE